MANNERVRVRGLSIIRPIIIGNTAVLLTPEDRASGTVPPEHTHRWTLAVRSAASPPDTDQVGGADDLSYFIKRVSFKLHETYPNPTRNIDIPPFEVSETGWGEFEVHIRITFIPESGEKAVMTYHHIKLHPWSIPEGEVPPPDIAAKAGPVHSWQYDEIVFNDPFQNFLNILTAHPPTPLPNVKRKPIPFHSSHRTLVEPGTPEFTTEMEREEQHRLEAARQRILAEIDKWKGILSDRERELESLQKRIQTEASAL